MNNGLKKANLKAITNLLYLMLILKKVEYLLNLKTKVSLQLIVKTKGIKELLNNVHQKERNHQT